MIWFIGWRICHKKKTSSADRTELKDILTSLIKRLTEDEKKAWQNKILLCRKYRQISDGTLLIILKQLKILI